MKNSKHSKILFFSEIPSFDFENEEVIDHWLKSVFEQEEVDFHLINIVFCSDDQLLEINQKYLHHDDFTDIITFPLKEDPIEAELYISVDRVVENAKTYKIEFNRELCRVMVHGILHLIGYQDKDARSKKQIREKEDHYLSQMKEISSTASFHS